MKNHYRMGRLIYAELMRNKLAIPRFPFLFGSLAPDICVSFVFRPHERAKSGRRFERLLRRLCEGNGRGSGALFAFQLGLLGHYICDFMCYAHTPAFRGDLIEHIRYEESQIVNAADLLPFPKKEKANLDPADMMRTLERYIAEHERLLAENDRMAYTDIPVAMYVATWAANWAVARKLRLERRGVERERDVEVAIGRPFLR